MAEFASSSATGVFALGGGREVVDAERAKELIAAAGVEDYASIKTIRLSNKSITEAAAEVFAEILAKCVNVSILDISDCIAGRPEEEALRSLTSICGSLGPFADNLIEVHVSDNALGVKGVNACRPVLVGKNMQRVYFCNNGMSAEAAALIGEIIAESKPPLTLMHFFNNMSGNGGGFALGKLISSCGATLTDIRFSATRCMAEGCAALLESMDAVQTLINLDISDNNFGAASKTNKNGELLARCVGKHVGTLRSLNLRDCGLGQQAVDGLVAGLRAQVKADAPAPALRVLDLSGNELTPKFCTSTCALLEPFAAALEQLNLEDNDELVTVEDDEEEEDDDEDEEGSKKNKGPSGSVRNALQLAALVSRCGALTALSLLNCELNTACAFAVLSSVRNTTGRTVHVKLDGNSFSEAGVALLEAAVADMPEDAVRLGDLEDNNEVDEEEDDVDTVAVTALLAAAALTRVATEAAASSSDDAADLAGALDKLTV
jgi:Ran GTPase-activating protein (RanGAP) involved in mRNA processing and transport